VDDSGFLSNVKNEEQLLAVHFCYLSRKQKLVCEPWQVFWLTRVSCTFPFQNETVVMRIRKLITTGLQLREQLRIFTGFPFHFLLPDRELKNQNSRQRYMTFSNYDHFLTGYFAYFSTIIAFDFLPTAKISKK
jgi:hypothetical protein